MARRKDWSVLPVLGAIGTALMQIGWVEYFFDTEHLLQRGQDVSFQWVSFLGFEASSWPHWVSSVAKRKTTRTVTASAIGWARPRCLGILLLAHPAGSASSGHSFRLFFLADIGVLAILFLTKRVPLLLAGISGLAVFGFLAIWTQTYLVSALLYVALAADIFSLPSCTLACLLSDSG